MAINIQIQYSKSPVTPGLQSYDLNVKALEATEMPKEIFVLQRGIAIPNTPNAPALPADDTFICIADPVDLEEFPAGAPNPTLSMPYFRVDEVTLRFRSLVELEEVETLIKEDITKLITALKEAATMTVVETVTYD